MIIAKIDYINLLPFMVFLKKYLKSDIQKSIVNAKKSYPSKINQQFKSRKANAAFISSIASKNCRCTDLGIVAFKEVWSVLAINHGYKKDKESMTSNALAKMLKIDKEIIIGDKALKFYFDAKEKNFEDLATLWYQKYKLPFVFARFCYNSNAKFYKKLAKNFLISHQKIPFYIKQQYAKSRGISTKQIDAYLQKINYKIDPRAKIALKKFLSEAK